MSTPETSRYVRLRVELVLEVTDSGELTDAALGRIAQDEAMPDTERAHADSAVREDSAEALAYLVDPFDLVSEVPGVDLAQASWSSEPVDYDPDAPDWNDDLDGDLDDDVDGDLDEDHDDDLDGEPVESRA
ncbi:hypothetical protein [Streptomyces apocyni]|uniref:hypothetical protein n=1 Tax=Streptomyces apocyni TaxID=2654677 RepID=UPI0012EA24E5|nr:hypothetical protein [Streptomyces apocyni]